MSRRKSFSVIGVVYHGFAVSVASSGGAEECAGAAEIRAAAAAYMEALRQGDAAKISEFWTEDGVYIDGEGHSLPARSLAKEEFAKPGPASEEKTPRQVVSSIHFVGPNVAIEQSSVTEPSAGGAATTGDARFMAAWVKQNDRWRLSLLREFPAASPASTAASSASPLNELSWMVGHWSAAEENADIELTVEWTADKSYLLQHFSATRAGEAVRRGTQRIAWDPAAKSLRSWTFNADGGFSEGAWRKEGDVWVAECTGVLADGHRTRSVHFWTKSGEDECWFKSLRGEVDGQPTDELMVKFSRSRSDDQ
jgi:uncharacterized protein (TIGR02246 family)